MTKALEIDPRLGDAICTAIEGVHGVDVDIILIVAAGGDWGWPSFITSVGPDVMEAVITQLGEQMADSVGGKRIVTGRHRT